MALDQPDTGDERSPKEAQVEKRKRWQFLTTLIAILASMGGLIVGIEGLFSSGSAGPTGADIRNAEQVAALNRNLAQIQHMLNESVARMDKLDNTQPATLQIAKLGAQLDSVQAQVKLLENAIGQSPEKALAVPLLKKDMDNLKDSYHHDLDSTQAEINRVYDQNKWFIGLMFTMAIGLLGLAISNFLQLRKQ